MGAGGRCLPEQSGPDEAAALADLLDSVGCDIIVVTGGRGPGVGLSAVPALERMRAEILVDAVDLDPGSRVVLAETRDGRRILFLPREPADAVVALALLLSPMMAALSAQLSPRWTTVMLREDSHPTERSRALPVAIEPGELADLAVAHPWQGPHGLAALARADAIAFLDAGKGRRGDSVPVVPLPGGT
jgi:molybdopterin molybdotransferase